MEEKRTNEYLEESMYKLWDENFSDIPRKNLVLIHFGKFSIQRLGSIKWADKRSKIKSLLNNKKDYLGVDDDKRITVITITRYFEELYVPEFVIDATIAHELVHYAHGFHSPLRQIYDKPHQGNIVKKELISRGLGCQIAEADEWLKKKWINFIKRYK